MTIAFSNLGVSAVPDFFNTTPATSFATASWAPPAADLIFLYVENETASGGTNQPTVSGNGITWTAIKSITVDDPQTVRLTLFGANAAGSTTGVTTISMAGQTQAACITAFAAATGVDLTGGVAAAFVQSPTVSHAAHDSTSGSITLSAAGASDNRPIVGLLSLGGGTQSPRANWTELDDNPMETQYRSDAFETTASMSWINLVAYIGIAAELKATLYASKVLSRPRTVMSKARSRATRW